MDLIAEITKAEKELKRRNPEAHCVYSPMEQKYQVCIWGKPVTADWYDDRLTALLRANEVLKNS